MRIFNTKVYGLKESIVRSGYPLQTSVGDMDTELTRSSNTRAKSLGTAPMGTGHDNFLCGIVVQADFEAPSYWWPEFQRYHHADIISSQSKMHRLTFMNLDEQCNEYVDQRAKDLLNEKIYIYNGSPTDENFEIMLSNTPMGLQLTAGVTTNYRQIKTMYYQREPHRQKMWKIFIPWAESLEMFPELCLGGKKVG